MLGKSKNFRGRVSIRTRLFLLVFAVWLPAMAGFGVLARSTYLHETEAATAHLRDLADATQVIRRVTIWPRASMNLR